MKPMRTLAIDTSTAVQVVALRESAGSDPTGGNSVSIPEGMNHGETLLKNIDLIFMPFRRRYTVRDIDLFVISNGPGSFTGLRVGLSVAKSLARAAHNASIVAVPSLEVFALSGYLRYQKEYNRCWHDEFWPDDYYEIEEGIDFDYVYACTDARRREIFYQRFRGPSQLKPETGPATISPDAFVELIDKHREAGESVLVAGNAHEAYKPIQTLAENDDDPYVYYMATQVEPEALLNIGVAKYFNNGPDNLEELVPDYVRPSDAKKGAGPLVNIKKP